MLREELKKELDKLSDDQLKQIADLIAKLEVQAKQASSSTPFWQTAAASERAKEFRDWTARLPQGSPSLPDSAFSRDSIYE